MIAPMQFMKHYKFTIPTLAAVLLLAGVSSLTAGLTGAIFTTDFTGTVVNGNQYDSPCSVFLNGGPGPHAPAHAAGLPDGDYFFQVTDPSGKTLLSTDPVSNRRFTVTGGVITAYVGVGGPAHATYPNLNDSPSGLTIELANSSCPADFLASPNNGGAYKVWVTPVTSFIGDPTKVDYTCGTGCFHGFIPSATKTDNFKIHTATGTFCLKVVKQDNASQPVAGWQFSVLDPVGGSNVYSTDSTGTVTACGLAPGAYTVSEASSSIVISLTVNGASVPNSTIYSFVWDASQPSPFIIVFQNNLFPG
jgi:prealbumin domain-containing protein